MTRLKWKLVSVRLEIVLILTQDRCMVCVECTIDSEIIFGRTQWKSYVMWVMWNLTSFSFGDRLVSVQDRCTVCAKRTIGSEIILGALSVTPR